MAFYSPILHTLHQTAKFYNYKPFFVCGKPGTSPFSPSQSTPPPPPPPPPPSSLLLLHQPQLHTRPSYLCNAHVRSMRILYLVRVIEKGLDPLYPM
jgi:hypothetical protein